MNYVSAFLPLIIIAAVAAIGFYARYRYVRWYERSSDMPEMLTASYAYQTLEYIDSHAARQGIDPEMEGIESYTVTSYMDGRGLAWRQHNDIIKYMKEMDWIHPTTIERNHSRLAGYAISKTGKRELKTPEGLRSAVEEAAEALPNEDVNGDQAKLAAASVIAAALRVHARTAPPESRERAEASADEIEKAVRAHDTNKIDRGIGRARDILQIMTYSLPFVREILRIFGSM
jgi:hypothetical protein